MAAATSNLLPISLSASESLSGGRTSRRRRITPEAVRAMETLGHAIEYLTDEFVNGDQPISVNNEQLEAVRLLMTLNRQVYLECQELPTFRERFRALARFA